MTAFDEKKIENRFWQAEPWDKNLPSPGFITDLVLYTRGIEVATIYVCWSAIAAISCVLQREAWLKWYPKKVYPNFYVFLVGPPAHRKSTAMDIMEDCIYKIPDKIKCPRTKALKTINIIGSECTAEAMHKRLKPTKKFYINESGVRDKLNIDSQAAIVASELATFLGKQSYNAGLIEKLILLYDCRDRDERTTLKNGQQGLKNGFVSLIGAITPGALKESIPEAAFGDGFMSRVIVAYNDEVNRVFPKPREVIGGPSAEDLTERLAWIAENIRGEYDFSPEAEEYYYDWYRTFKTKTRDVNVNNRAIFNRLDIHYLKLCLVVKANSYETDHVIQLWHVKEAQRILEATVADSERAIEDVGVSPYQHNLIKLERYLEKKKTVQRRLLLTHFSGMGITAEGLTKAMDHLLQEGKIEVYKQGVKQRKAGIEGKEEYVWTPTK